MPWHPKADRASPEKVEGCFVDALTSGGALVVTNRDGEVIGKGLLFDHAVYELSRTAWAERA
jgi:hypothetical protein